MTEKTQQIKTNIQGEPGKDIIADFILRHSIDTSIWYIDSFKVKEGKYEVAAAKREQNLTWVKGKGKYGDNQIMEGHAKRYPEFIVNDNKVYSLELTFKRIPIEHDILTAYKEMTKKFPICRKKKDIPVFKPGSGIALELSTFDAHFQKLSWEQETGYRNYDLNIATKDYQYVYQNLMNWALPFKPEQIFDIVGQDLYHSDNMAGKTTNGDHTLDVDGRITKTHKKIFQIKVETILEAKKLAPVKVIWSPGNHDYLASYMLVFALSQYFRNDPLVTFDIGYNPRKIILWGTLAVGFTHRIVGRHNVWYNELAQAFPEEWYKSYFREWHHGDQHKKQTIKTWPVTTSGGVTLRQLTALSPVDRWHTDNIYTDAIPGGEGFLLSKTQGVFANFMAWTGQYEINRNNLINDKQEPLMHYSV